MPTKVAAVILIALALSGCLCNQTQTFVCPEDNSKIVLRSDGTYTVLLTDVCSYSGDYQIIDDQLILNYLAAGTSGAFVLQIENGTLIDSMNYRWNLV